MSNMFKDMNIFGGVQAEGIGDVNGQLILVEVIAALTDYTHTPHNRAPMPHLPSTMMDDLVLENRQGTLTENAMKNYAAHMGSLNNMPGDAAKIRGGYTEYNKGLMKLKFRIQNGGVSDEYISVMGYLTNNDLEGQISSNATFIPTYSWRHSTMMDGAVGQDGLSFCTEQIGRRTDYLLNDGSYGQNEGLAAMRPNDVLNAAGDNLAADAVLEQLQAEGAVGSKDTPVMGNGAINLVGVVCSNRKNMNPTKYAEQVLKGSVRANQKMMFNISGGDGNRVTSDYSSEMSIISDLANEMYQTEYRPRHDEFLNCMKELSGNFRNMRGWLISDIVYMFPNFPDIIMNNGCTLLDRNEYPICDFSEIAQVFGTSSPVETIAQELIFNIMDVMMVSGLSGIEIKASNCDQMAGEDRLSNITLLPYNIKSLASNDIYAFQKGTHVCEQLRTQIFNKLNGFGLSGLTPLRIRMNVSLMGSTEMWITNMSSESGLEIYYCFPTFAATSWSPVFGNNDTLTQLSDSVYGGIKSYFLER